MGRGEKDKKLQESDILNKLTAKFPDLNLELATVENGDRSIFVPADKIDVVVEFLKTSPELKFDFLMSVSAFDSLKLTPDDLHIQLTYHLYSYAHRHTIILKVKTPREGGVVKTLCALYGCANYQ